MLYLSPYETLIIIGVFLLITFGPPLAGIAVAFVRKMRGKPAKKRKGARPAKRKSKRR